VADRRVAGGIDDALSLKYAQSRPGVDHDSGDDPVLNAGATEVGEEENFGTGFLEEFLPDALHPF
jgi:hypothetical protein